MAGAGCTGGAYATVAHCLSAVRWEVGLMRSIRRTPRACTAAVLAMVLALGWVGASGATGFDVTARRQLRGCAAQSAGPSGRARAPGNERVHPRRQRGRTVERRHAGVFGGRRKSRAHRGARDGVGAAARFDRPKGIATDGTDLYVSDTGNNTIRKVVVATGTVSTIAGGAERAGSRDGIGSAARFDQPWASHSSRAGSGSPTAPTSRCADWHSRRVR